MEYLVTSCQECTIGRWCSVGFVIRRKEDDLPIVVKSSHPRTQLGTREHGEPISTAIRQKGVLFEAGIHKGPSQYHHQPRVRSSSFRIPLSRTSAVTFGQIYINTMSEGHSAPVKFGSFEAVCEHAALLVCPLLHTPHGVEPDCYGRNVQLGSQLIFQPGEPRRQE